MKQTIINYLKTTYQPTAILLYGSFVDGSNDETSDFDCMVIVSKKEKNHDSSIVAGVQLDCFIFTEAQVRDEDIDTFLTAYDAEIILDNGIGADLKSRVRDYVATHSTIEASEKNFIANWIRKTMRRMQKNDDEGNFRAVAFLWESLTDYCFLRDIFYFGSKKTTHHLMAHDKEGYQLYHRAITEKSMDAIQAWASYVISVIPQ